MKYNRAAAMTRSAKTSDEDNKAAVPPSCWAAGGRRRIPARYSFAAVLMLGSFLNIMLRTSLPMAVTAMARRNATGPRLTSGDSAAAGEFDWDEVAQSYVLTASSYGMLVTCVAGARLAELWSRRLATAACTLVSGACFLLLPLAAAWGLAAAVASQVVAGLFAGPLLPVQMAMTASWFPPQERQQLGGITFSAMSLATMSSNVLTGKLVDTLGWRFVFYFFSSLMMTWVVLWMFLAHDGPNSHPSISEEERTYITESTGVDESQTVSTLPWRDMLLSAPLWAHITMGLPACWVALLFVNSLPSYMTNTLHFSSTKAGYILALPQLSMWLCTITFGWLSQWVRRKEFIGHRNTYLIFNFIATAGPATAFVVLPLVGGHEAATISLLVLATACSGAYVGGSQLNHMDLAVNYSGTLSGLSSAVLGVVGVLAPTVTGLVTNNQQTLSAWSNVFYVAAGVNVVPFFIYLFFGSVEEQPWNTPLRDLGTDGVDKTTASSAGVQLHANE
ncbi:sialin-like isoform X2 [Bacillus rossius redtenbacheri]|uniref:sialin-like isoform X2 n=1 Tax=Bacillus rossius redtenbacheri TaxID=93214 RepID=UPI002FDE3AF2